MTFGTQLKTKRLSEPIVMTTTRTLQWISMRKIQIRGIPRLRWEYLRIKLKKLGTLYQLSQSLLSLVACLCLFMAALHQSSSITITYLSGQIWSMICTEVISSKQIKIWTTLIVITSKRGSTLRSIRKRASKDLKRLLISCIKNSAAVARSISRNRLPTLGARTSSNWLKMLLQGLIWR